MTTQWRRPGGPLDRKQSKKVGGVIPFWKSPWIEFNWGKVIVAGTCFGGAGRTDMIDGLLQ